MGRSRTERNTVNESDCVARWRTWLRQLQLPDGEHLAKTWTDLCATETDWLARVGRRWAVTRGAFFQLTCKAMVANRCGVGLVTATLTARSPRMHDATTTGWRRL